MTNIRQWSVSSSSLTATHHFHRTKKRSHTFALSARTLAVAACIWMSTTSQNAALAAEEFIAGTAPAERPVSAPRITEYKKPDGWYGDALTGLEEPYPRSFRFLEDQEGWYTPFNQPGMTGPYDIRGWHDSNAHTLPYVKQNADEV